MPTNPRVGARLNVNLSPIPFYTLSVLHRLSDCRFGILGQRHACCPRVGLNFFDGSAGHQLALLVIGGALVGTLIWGFAAAERRAAPPIGKSPPQ